ncbi:MAG: hypothetical protein KAH33_00085, partial [Candidatus Delongbacteria bacterium]|nr:hypothetical protein [Candidatus Delongbacteria bacterium]
TQWDDVNIGSYSVAFGNNNTTSGAYSFAAGSGNSITGIASSAFGLSNNVTRPYSYAFGNNSSATGSYSFAFGRYSEAQALHSIALGRFNVVSGTWGTWIDSEPLFILGNGADDLNRSNALTVFKDGRTTIGSDTRGEMLTVEGTVESTMGGFKFPDGSTQTSAATGGGDITSVTAGIGLTGGGVTGDVTLNVDMAGSGSATTVSHSDHEHGINDLTDGKTGGYSVFLGYNAGFNDNGSLGNDNVGTGHAALYNNITGSNNAAFGYHALMANTSGQYNIGIGSLSNLYNQEGSQNTIIGHLAGSGGILHNKSGNVFIGFSAGFFEYSNNKLYIENTTSSSPLIYGDFTDGSEIVKINGDFQVTGELRDSDNQPGTNGQMLSSNGTGTDWVDIISVTTHYIGESYGGGIVFYVYDEGKHGLIVDTSGESTGEWYNGTYRYTGTTGDGLYAGTMNTAMIVATQMADNQTGNFVAKVCADYSVTDGGVTYGDWYLPSKYELNLLYLQKDVVGGLQGGGYWSSTEISSDSAWFQWFFSGEQDEDTKNTVGYVRAIRAF